MSGLNSGALNCHTAMWSDMNVYSISRSTNTYMEDAE